MEDEEKKDVISHFYGLCHNNEHREAIVYLLKVIEDSSVEFASEALCSIFYDNLPLSFVSIMPKLLKGKWAISKDAKEYVEDSCNARHYQIMVNFTDGDEALASKIVYGD